MADLVRITFTYDGRRYYIKGRTKKEAEEKAAQKKEALIRQEIIASKRTVGDWWKEYITVYKTKASDKTKDDYESIYRNAIAPYIGQMALKSVKSVDCQRIMNNLSGKSASYVKKTKNLLTGIFQTAVDNDLLPKSPVRNLNIPEAEDGERRALTSDEREAFLAAAETLEHRGLFFLIIYHCGLRPSEVVRIVDTDIDRINNTLHVRGSKTKAATRTVPIPEALKIPLFKGTLFKTTKGATFSKTAVRYWWEKVTKKMEENTGIPFAEDLTPYCLRHDYCTRLQEVGVPIDVARRLMGHSSIEVTSRIYTHENDASINLARHLINKPTAPNGKNVKFCGTRFGHAFGDNSGQFRTIRLKK